MGMSEDARLSQCALTRTQFGHFSFFEKGHSMQTNTVMQPEGRYFKDSEDGNLKVVCCEQRHLISQSLL